MTDNKIEPHKVTKPIQLLAAWLVGLLLIDAMFLAAMLQLESGTWERGTLLVAAILNVPMFLGALFILQTKFRPELQDDSHYANYISKKNEPVRIDPATTINQAIDAIDERYSFLTRLEAVPDSALRIQSPIETYDHQLDWSGWRVSLNERLPRFKEVREALRQAGIPLSETFGNAANVLLKSPDVWVVSINRAMPLSHKVALLRTLTPFQLDGFQLWTPLPEADETEDVYIGSYGANSYAVFTPALTALLANDIEEVDLKIYADEHKVKRV